MARFKLNPQTGMPEEEVEGLDPATPPGGMGGVAGAESRPPIDIGTKQATRPQGPGLGALVNEGVQESDNKRIGKDYAEYISDSAYRDKVHTDNPGAEARLAPMAQAIASRDKEGFKKAFGNENVFLSNPTRAIADFFLTRGKNVSKAMFASDEIYNEGIAALEFKAAASREAEARGAVPVSSFKSVPGHERVLTPGKGQTSLDPFQTKVAEASMVSGQVPGSLQDVQAAKAATGAKDRSVTEAELKLGSFHRNVDAYVEQNKRLPDKKTMAELYDRSVGITATEARPGTAKARAEEAGAKTAEAEAGFSYTKNFNAMSQARVNLDQSKENLRQGKAMAPGTLEKQQEEIDKLATETLLGLQKFADHPVEERLRIAGELKDVAVARAEAYKAAVSVAEQRQGLAELTASLRIADTVLPKMNLSKADTADHYRDLYNASRVLRQAPGEAVESTDFLQPVRKAPFTGLTPKTEIKPGEPGGSRDVTFEGAPAGKNTGDTLKKDGKPVATWDGKQWVTK